MNQVVILGDTDPEDLPGEPPSKRLRRVLVGLAVFAALAIVGAWGWNEFGPQEPFEVPEAVVLQEVEAALYVRQPDGTFEGVGLPGDALSTFNSQPSLFETEVGWLVPLRNREEVSLVLVPYESLEPEVRFELGSLEDRFDIANEFVFDDEQLLIHRAEQVEVYDLELELVRTIDLVGDFRAFTSDGGLILESVPGGETLTRRVSTGAEAFRAQLTDPPLHLDGSIVWVEESDAGAERVRSLFHMGADGTVDEVAVLDDPNRSQLLVQLVAPGSVLVGQGFPFAPDAIGMSRWTRSTGLVELDGVRSIIGAPTPEGIVLLGNGDEGPEVVLWGTDAEVTRQPLGLEVDELASAQVLTLREHPGFLVYAVDSSGGFVTAYIGDLGSGDVQVVPFDGTPVGLLGASLMVRSESSIQPGALLEPPSLVSLDLATGEAVEIADAVSFGEFVSVTGDGIFFRYEDSAERPGTWRLDLSGSDPVQVSDAGTPASSAGFERVVVVPQVAFFG